MYQVYPSSPAMVIVNHSLGGVITHLQVIDSGDALVNEIFKDKAQMIKDQPDNSPVKKALIFKATPPHQARGFCRGAPPRSSLGK